MWSTKQTMYKNAEIDKIAIIVNFNFLSKINRLNGKKINQEYRKVSSLPLLERGNDRTSRMF